MKKCPLCQRPYHVESTGSRPITEVKQRRARLVLGWVTAWESLVLLTKVFALFPSIILVSSECSASELNKKILFGLHSTQIIL